MKVLHAPFCYYPDPVGGTEIYVELLARTLRARDISSVIAVGGERDERTVHDGVPVYRFREGPPSDLRTLYGVVDSENGAPFFRVVDEERPDLVHLHASTRLTSARVVRALHERGIPVVFTYHLPTATCQRGTLMRWGREVCDGLMDNSLCTRCTLESLGTPRPVAEILGRLPGPVGEAAGRVGLEGGGWTALRMRELVELRLDTTRGFLSEVDRIVVLAGWAREVLRVNGVEPEKIVLSRHGVDEEQLRAATDLQGAPPQLPPLRLAFLGRVGPAKGPDILVSALRLLPEAQVELDLFGITQDDAGRDAWHELMQLADGDERIRFQPPIPQADVTSLLRRYHMLAVPSRWLETGPLVVLEAFAAGVPVIGMNRGGIAELVSDGENGLLVDGESPEEWRDAIVRLVENPHLLEQLRAGVRPPRSMNDIGEEMAALYCSLLLSRKVRAH